MNHVCHRLVYLRARAMLNSVIHTSQVLEGAEIPGTIAIKIRFCASASVRNSFSWSANVQIYLF